MWRIVFVVVLGIAGRARADGLRRVLDDGERAFLSRPVTGILDAVNASRAAKKQKPCTRQGGDVEPWPEMTPWGALPAAWRSIVLLCEGLKFQLKLSPEPASPQESELRDGAAGARPGAMTFAAAHRIKERGDGFVVLESTFDDSRTTTLYVGEISAFPAPLPEKLPGLLAVPKSAEFFDAAGGPIRDAIDAGAVLKVLRASEAPPPVPPPEVPGKPLDSASVHKLERSLFDSIMTCCGMDPVALAPKIPADFAEVVVKAAPDASRTALEAFVRANPGSKTHSADALPAGSEFVPQGSPADSAGVFRFSHAGFASDGSQAVVMWSTKGGGRISIYRRAGSGWRELYELPL